MRISDWSSDVCSSDLLGPLAIAFSPIFVRLSEVGPTATGFYRAILAVPPIWLWWRFMPALPRIAGQPRPLPPLALILVPGLLFAGDLFFWHLAIKYTTVANADRKSTRLNSSH